MAEHSHPPIRLMEHNPQWAQEFEQARSSILQATEGWIVDIQHVGSTAIAGGVARPIVDLIAGMDDLQGINEAALLVEGLNYARLSSPDWCSEELSAFLQKPRSGDPSHTVLLMRRDSAAWERSLAIREHLQNNLLDWEQLQNLKKDNFATGCTALANYTAAKDEYFAELESRIGGDA